jgi:hypothetical protein
VERIKIYITVATVGTKEQAENGQRSRRRREMTIDGIEHCPDWLRITDGKFKPLKVESKRYGSNQRKGPFPEMRIKIFKGQEQVDCLTYREIEKQYAIKRNTVSSCVFHKRRHRATGLYFERSV